MKLIGMLLITLANGGHWFGGNCQTVRIEWNIEQPIPGAVLNWELRSAGASLASGSLALPQTKQAAELMLKLPEVGVQTDVVLKCRVKQPDGKTIALDDISIRLYPKDLLADAPKRLANKKLYVWQHDGKLDSLLKQAAIPHTSITSAADLQFTEADIIIVDGDVLSSDPLEQSPLLSLAQSGASVMILKQERPPSLGGYSLVRRAAPEKLIWREHHPLCRSLRLFDPADKKNDLWAIRLPVDEPALEIVSWPPEVSGKKPAPIDALVLTKTMGRGRLVLCQVPLGDWLEDPRNQQVLADSLDYLASRPSPTPPPSRRKATTPSADRPEKLPNLLPGEDRE